MADDGLGLTMPKRSRSDSARRAFDIIEEAFHLVRGADKLVGLADEADARQVHNKAAQNDLC